MRIPSFRMSLGLSVLFLVACAPTRADEPRVPRWQPHDFAFVSKTAVENPFRVTFSATVTQPDGKTWDTLGFFDEVGVWKVRVAPQLEGNWSLVTHSKTADLDGKRASFVCVKNSNPRIHGGLQVDRAHPRHFIFADGQRFFPLGYECDWLWALDLGKKDATATDAFLDRLAEHGFNYVILNAYAHDTAWRPGKTSDDDYGPPPLYAWAGTNRQPDHSRLNLDYWRHFDRVLAAMSERGMIAHVMIKVYNKKVRWPAKGGPDDDQYFRWLVARYAAFPNVVWDFSKEAHNEKNTDYKLGRIRLVRQSDPYHRLVTVHDDNVTYDSGAYDPPFLDYRSDQQHSRWRETILAQRKQHRWPVLNVELGYEHGPGGLSDRTWTVAQPPEEVCRRAWEISLAGGYTVYYYHNTAWDVIKPTEVPPGYRYFKNLRSFFETTNYWRLEPTEGLASDGYCLAEPGREYVVFQNDAKPFTLRVEKAAAPLAAEWYQPFTGKKLSAGRLSNGLAELKPPADWGTGPVALHVSRVP